MEKVYVNVDYQVLVGGAIKPVRIYWHDGRAYHPLSVPVQIPYERKRDCQASRYDTAGREQA